MFSKSLEEWAFIISSGIPDRVKSALGCLTAPTYKEPIKVPAVCTKNAGVYARLMHNRLNLGTQDRFVYVGSARKFGLGLGQRISEHIGGMRRAKKKYQAARACKTEAAVKLRESHKINNNRSRYLQGYPESATESLYTQKLL